MNKLLSSIEEIGRKYFSLGRNNELIQILSSPLNLNESGNIDQDKFTKIIQYQIEKGTPTFFVIGGSQKNEKEAFKLDHVNGCIESDWYMIIRSNDSSYIIFPKLKKGFIFNGSTKEFIPITTDGDEWGKGGGCFQIDKNIGKKVIYSPLNEQTAFTLFNEKYKN